MKTSDIRTRAQFYEFANIWYRRAINLHNVWKDRSRSEVDRMRAFELSIEMQRRIYKLNKIAIELNKIDKKPKFPLGGEVKQLETEKPNNCIKEYSGACEKCEHLNYEMVPHPGGETTSSQVEAEYCELGYFNSEF